MSEWWWAQADAGLLVPAWSGGDVAFGTSATITPGSAGDLVMVEASVHSDSSAPLVTAPAGWTVLLTQKTDTGNPGASHCVAWRYAPSTSFASGTFTNANSLCWASYSGAELGLWAASVMKVNGVVWPGLGALSAGSKLGGMQRIQQSSLDGALISPLVTQSPFPKNNGQFRAIRAGISADFVASFAGGNGHIWGATPDYWASCFVYELKGRPA